MRTEPAIDHLDWAAAYEAHALRLTRLATLLVGPSDAHDLVADAVMRAVGSRHWRSVASPGAYLAQTLVHLAEDGRRRDASRASREIRSIRLTGLAAVGPIPDLAQAVAVRAALGALSAGQLAVVYLHYWEDLTLDRVATELGVTVGTARKQLDRAKRRLRPLVSPSEEDT